MWGQICTESSYQLNFNFGFSTYKSDILLHLSQWQYWWWFWFSFFWTFYYFLILRTVKNRTTKMNPKINTSLRGRGKWGDFLIAVLPLSWCANILLNSNFILRMFEWQNESSLFTVRIHGKQWYWVYKFDLIDAIDILTVPKNVGNNRWIVGTPEELTVCESYLQAIQIRSQEDWIKNYWRKKLQEDLKTFKLLEADSLRQSTFVKNTGNYLLTYTSIFVPRYTFLNKYSQFYDSFYKNFFNYSNYHYINIYQLFNYTNSKPKEVKFVENAYTYAIKTQSTTNEKNLAVIEDVHTVHEYFKQKWQDLKNFEFSNLPYSYSLDWMEKFFSWMEKFKKKLVPIDIFHKKMFKEQSSLFSTLLYDYPSDWMEKFKKKLLPIDIFHKKMSKEQSSFVNPFEIYLNNSVKHANMMNFYDNINKPLLATKNFINKICDISDFYDEDGVYSIDIFDDITYDNLYYNYDELDDTWDVDYNLRHEVNSGPIKITKHLLTPEYLKDNTDLLRFNFYDNNDQTSPKVADNGNFWVLKQKRYKKKQLLNVSSKKDVEYMTFDAVRNIYRKHIIENIKLIQDLDFQMDSYTLFKCVRNNKHRTESLPVHLYRRLLRTKRTLVLPAHINMTVVTNSYDVVHSWFLPGLGIKMDCVPGRSTHHSLYLDNIGFYYGQCAEICGRYHHHMPIRLCALPFEHFLVWWQLKGLPKLLRIKKQKKELVNHAVMKYTW